jgi:hypothetical protein
MALLNVQVLTTANSTQTVTNSLTVAAVAPFTVVTSSLPISIPIVTTPVTGTIGVTNASAAVTGVGTTFSVAFVGGSKVQFVSQPGVTYTVLAVTSDTTLTLTTTYTGTTNTSTAILLQYVNVTTGLPTPTQFLVNYTTGILTFNAALAGVPVVVMYSATFYTPTVGATGALVEMWGGGGQGGGAVGGLPITYAVGSGGGAGGYARYFLASLAGPYQIGIGTGGGTAVIGASLNGGNTFFNTGTTIVTAYGGQQGNTIQVGASVPKITLGGLGGAISTNGTYNGAGNPGEEGLILSGTFIKGGAGGATSLGGAGAALGITGTGNGNTAVANTGSGGSGGINTNTTALSLGGLGSAGVMIVSEYV